MEDPSSRDATPTAPRHAADVTARSRRRRLTRILTALLLGFVVWAYTLGALNQRVVAEDTNDLLPVPLEALIMGVSFALASLPVAWSIVPRMIIPVPSLLLYLTVFLGKDPALPYYAAFAVAALYSAALTALSSVLAERPERARLGSRVHGSHH